MTSMPGHRLLDLRALPISLQIDQFSSEIIFWGFRKPAWWRNYLHVHSHFEVCYAYQGKGTFRINDHVHNVQAGQLFVARPGEQHEVVSSEGDPLGIYYWAYTLVPAEPQASAKQNDVNSLFYNFLTSTQCVSDQVGQMGRIFPQLISEIVNKEAGYRGIIENLTAQLIIIAARAVTDMPNVPEPEMVDPNAAIVDDIVRYLHDNFHQPLLMRDIAAHVHLSERHTNRLFRAKMGMPIKTYFTNLRLEAASQMLLNQKLSVSEVAYAIGFQDVRYFATLFRRKMGSTPSAFRESGGTQFLEG